MRINPPEVAYFATIYRMWERSQMTRAWEVLGDSVATLCQAKGGWGKAQSWLAEYLPDLPQKTLELALADHNLRTANKAISN